MIFQFIRIFIAAIIIIPALILSMIPYSIMMMLKKMKNEKAYDKILHFSLRSLIYIIVFMLGGNVKLYGVNKVPRNAERLCYISNHQSMIDVCAVLYPRGLWCGFIGKVEVKKIPIVAQWFEAIKSVYLDRKSPRDSIKAILDGSKLIQSGHPMGIFPEGTRSKDGDVHEFKAGSFKMATRAKAIIQPIAISGTRDILENGKSILRRKVYIKYLDPINTANMSEEELNELPKRVENLIRQEVENFRKC